jgi:S1-C subfamily serine protease
VQQPGERLRYYASQFPLVEVDSSYYAMSKPEVAELWAKRTPPRTSRSTLPAFNSKTDYVQTVASALKATGHVARAWLNVSTAPPPHGEGTFVVAVERHGPADRAGIARRRLHAPGRHPSCSSRCAAAPTLLRGIGVSSRAMLITATSKAPA